MSGLAMVSLKFPSLLKFDEAKEIEFITVLSDHLSDYKKNTYVFVKAIM